MKVGIVYQYIYPQSFGGGEKRLYEIYSRFPEECEVDWYCQYTEDYSKYNELKRFNIIPLEKNKKSAQKRSYVETISFCLKVFWKINMSKYDIIHIGQMPVFHIFFLYLKKFLYLIAFKKTPLIIVDWWEVWGSYWKNKYFYPVALFGQLIEKIILLTSDFLVVISNKTQQDLKPFTIAEVVLIHNGVNLKLIDSIPASIKKYDVIIFGRVEKWKNPQMGVYVFQKMLELDSNLKMLIVGDGSYLETLKKYVEDNKMSSNVDFYGFAKTDEEVYGHIKASRLMMQFSMQEGGGSITLFEANACGIPVASAFYANGIDSQLVTEKNGFFYFDHDYEQIAKSLISYLEDENKQRQMEKSTKNFVANFDWSNISKEYYDFFERIIEERA